MKFFDVFKRPPRVESLRPFTYVTPSVGTVRKFVFAMMLPQLIMLVITKSYMSLLIVLATTLGSMISEIVFCLISKSKKVEYLSPVINGILIGLLVPSSYSFVSIFFITVVALLVGKYAFGGFAQSWINSVALVVVVAYIINIPAFSTVSMGTEMYSTRNVALTYIQNPEFNIVRADSAVTSFFNRTVFRIFGIVIPDGYVSLLWDNGSIIPAFRFNLITMISSIILMALDLIDVIIPFIFIALYSLLVRIIGPVFSGAPMMQGDIIFALLTSGTLFCTLYLLQWYGTVPITNLGKVIYAVIACIVAFLVIGYGNSSVGYVFTILIMNLISPVIQLFESRMARNKLQTVLNPRIKAIKEAKNV